MLDVLYLNPHDSVTPFPNVAQALTDPDGLLAIGGNLSVSRLLQAYRNGIFPWYNPGQPILWWSPAQRAVITPDTLHISRSLHRVIRQGQFTITTNQAFAAVIQQCAAPRKNSQGTWITPAMLEAYTELHQQGYAESIECWQDNQLVGGLYGVRLGAVFFAESMFSHCSNASKVALVYTVQQPKLRLLDCQFLTPHLASMGAILLPREQFVELIK